MKMRDLAKLASVSPSTVLRMLSQPELINMETREKVLNVSKKVNYKPHIVARQFRTQKTKIILVVVPDITSAFFIGSFKGN